MAVMSSYNLVNGEHTNNSKDLINYVMRDEWGYEGLVMTDWFAVGGFMAAADTRVNKHPIGDQAGCIYAGNDLIMPGMAKDFEWCLRCNRQCRSKISHQQGNAAENC